MEYSVWHFILGAFVALIVLGLFNPVLLGTWIYNLNIAIESRIYGFKRHELAVAEYRLSLYHNGIKDRPTIVMLHGFTADAIVWLRFAQYFNKQYNVIIPDLLGHGETGFKDEWSYRTPEQAKCIKSLLDNLNITKAHIIGNSMGGFISAQFALRYPDHCISATLVDPAGIKSVQSSDMELLLEQGINPFLIFNRGKFSEFYAMTMHKPPWVPKIVLNVVASKYLTHKDEFERIFNDFIFNDLLDDELENITVPTLILWGDQDRLIHVANADKWQQGIQNSELKIWPGIGHMPMLEIPKQSAQVYQDFLNKLP